MQAEVHILVKEQSKVSAKKQKKIFGGFWSSEANAAKSSLYEDIVSEEAAAKVRVSGFSKANHSNLYLREGA